MRKGILSIVLLLAALLVVACGGSEQEAAPTTDGLSAEAQTGLPQGEPIRMAEGTYFDIDINQVKPLLEDDSVFTVNVHIPYAGDLPGTDASIPFNEVAQQIDALPADRDAPIVVYCRSGSMSTHASETLVGLGYTRVFNLTGGMIAWERAGNQLLRPDQSLNPQPDPSSDTQGPRLVFTQPSVDYGDVPIDRMVTHRFEFTNQGDAPLVIDGRPAVETLAGC